MSDSSSQTTSTQTSDTTSTQTGENTSTQTDETTSTQTGDTTSTQTGENTSDGLPSDLPGNEPQGPLPPYPNDPPDVGVPIVPPEGVRDLPIDYDEPPFPGDIAPTAPPPVQPPWRPLE